MSINDLLVIKATLEPALCPEAVFGPVADAEALKKTFRHLAAVTHPDKYAADKAAAELAQSLFAKIVSWNEVAMDKFAKGTYGDKKPHVPAAPTPGAHAPQVIQTLKRKFIVTDLLAAGDMADVYRCAYTEDGIEHHAAFKIARSAGDNDLLDVEQKTLSAMYPAAQVEEKFYRYFPKPLDSFLLRDTDLKTNRRVNVMQLADGYVTLADVLKAYPKGIDFRDAVWMFKRGLAGIGYAHKKGIVHGAIVPPHVLVHPTGHGGKIVDWCYSVSSGQRVQAISRDYKAFYAPEILAKKSVTSATDIYMLAKCMVVLLGGDVETSLMPDAVPKGIRLFLGALLLKGLGPRPDDAWALHEEFDELLLRVVGKRHYRPLAMPARS